MVHGSVHTCGLYGSMCTMMNRYIYLYSLILCLLSCSLENQRTDDRSISVDIEQRDIISVYDLFRILN